MMETYTDFETVRDVTGPYPLPVSRIGEWPSLTERYFEPRFHRPKSADHQTGDQCVLFHSNR